MVGDNDLQPFMRRVVMSWFTRLWPKGTNNYYSDVVTPLQCYGQELGGVALDSLVNFSFCSYIVVFNFFDDS